jgi:hypothetical protein
MVPPGAGEVGLRELLRRQTCRNKHEEERSTRTRTRARARTSDNTHQQRKGYVVSSEPDLNVICWVFVSAQLSLAA